MVCAADPSPTPDMERRGGLLNIREGGGVESGDDGAVWCRVSSTRHQAAASNPALMPILH